MKEPLEQMVILDPDFQSQLLQQFAELEQWYLTVCDMNDPYIKLAYGLTGSLRVQLQQWIRAHEFSEIKV